MITVAQIRDRNVARRTVELVLHVCLDGYQSWRCPADTCERCGWSPLVPGVVDLEHIAGALVAMFADDAVLFADALTYRIEELLAWLA